MRLIKLLHKLLAVPIIVAVNFIGAFDFTRAIENARNTSKKEQRTA